MTREEATLYLSQHPGRTLYRVGNNTDRREDPFYTTSYAAGRRAYSQIRPGASAGNLYHASFQRRCTCAEWTDAESIAAHCESDK